jgi:hypothetical protein
MPSKSMPFKSMPFKCVPFKCLDCILLLVCVLLSPALHAQDLLASTHPDAPMSFVEASPAPAASPSTISGDRHRFWDKQNCALFAAAGALSAADFGVTRANLQNGGQELNPMVRLFGRGTPGLAANFIGENAAMLSLSYFLHRTGHHKLERVASLVNIAGSAGAVSYGLAHR